MGDTPVDGATVRVTKIWPDTHLICTEYEDRGLSFNQYLIEDDDPLLVHTGSATMVNDVIEGIQEVLPVEQLSYVLATHFEADECGGLATLLEHNPSIRPVGSETTARQLSGFGIHDDTLVRTGGDSLELGHRTLELIDYPAEMHLWNGLLAYDPRAEGLFSSDLFRRRGAVEELMVEEALDVVDIPEDRCPADDLRFELAGRLETLDPRWVAPGHGPVIARK